MSSDLPSSQQTNNNQQKSTSSNEPKKRVCFICGSYTDLTINIYEPRAGPNIVDVINEKFNVQPLNDDKYLCYSCNNWLINWHSLQNKNETSSGSKKYVNKISKNKFNSNRTIPEEELESIVTISAEMTNTKDKDTEVAAKKILNIDNLCSVSKEADELRKNLKKYFYYPKKLLATNTNHHHHHHHMVLPSASEQQFAAITTIPLISHRKKILDVFRKKQQQKQLQKQRRQLRYKLMKKYIKCNLCGKLMRRQNQSISQQYQLQRKYHQYLKNITTKLCQKCKQYLRKLYVMIKEQQEQDEQQQQQQQQHLNGNSNRTSIYSDYYQQQSDNISDLVNPNLIIKLQKLGTTVRYENSPLPQSTSTTTTTTTITTSTSTINSTSTTINEHNKFSTIFNYNNDIDNYDDNNDYYEEIFRDIDNEEYIQQQQQQQQYQQHQQDQSRNKNDILITFNKVITEALPLDLLKFIRNL